MEESLPLRRSTRKSVIAKCEELTPSKRNVSTPVKTEPNTPSRRTRASSSTPRKSLIQIMSTPKKTLTVLNEEDTPKKSRTSNINVSNLTPKKGDNERTPRKLELKKSPKRNTSSLVNNIVGTKENNLTPKKGTQDDLTMLVDAPMESNIAEDRPLTRAKRKTMTEKQVTEIEKLSGEIAITDSKKGKKSVNFSDLSFNKSNVKESSLSSTAMVPKVVITDCVTTELKEAKKAEYIDNGKEIVKDYTSNSPVRAEDVFIASPKKIPEHYKSTSEKSLLLNEPALEIIKISYNSHNVHKSPKDIEGLPISNDTLSLHYQTELGNGEHTGSEKRDTVEISVNDSKLIGDISENSLKDVDDTVGNTELQWLSETDNKSDRINVNNKKSVTEVESSCENSVENIVTNQAIESDLSSEEITNKLGTSELLLAKSDEKKVSNDIPGNQKCVENEMNLEDIGFIKVDHKISEVLSIQNDTGSEMVKQDKDLIKARNTSPTSTKLIDGIVNNKDNACSSTKDVDNTKSLVVSNNDDSVFLTDKVIESQDGFEVVANGLLTQFDRKFLTKSYNEERGQVSDITTEHNFNDVHKGSSTCITDKNDASQSIIVDKDNNTSKDKISNPENNFYVDIDKSMIPQPTITSIPETNPAVSVNEKKDENLTDIEFINIKPKQSESEDPVVHTTSIEGEEYFLSNTSVNSSEPNNIEAKQNKSNVVSLSDNDISNVEKSVAIEISEQGIDKSILMETNDNNCHSGFNDLSITVEKGDEKQSTPIVIINLHKTEGNQCKKEGEGCDVLEVKTNIFENKSTYLKDENSLKLENNTSLLTEDCFKESFIEQNVMNPSEISGLTNETIKPALDDMTKHESKNTNICENSDLKCAINASMLTTTGNEKDPDNSEIVDAESVSKDEATVSPVDSENSSKTTLSKPSLNESSFTESNNVSITNLPKTIENKINIIDDENMPLNVENFNGSSKDDLKELVATNKAVELEDMAVLAINVTGGQELHNEEMDKSFTDSHFSCDSKKTINNLSISYEPSVEHERMVNLISKNDVTNATELTIKVEGLDEILMSPKDFLNSDEESVVDEKRDCPKTTTEGNFKLDSENLAAEELQSDVKFSCSTSCTDSCGLDNIGNESIDLIENITVKKELSENRSNSEECCHLIDNLKKSNEDISGCQVGTELQEKECSSATVNGSVIAINEVESSTYNIISDIKNELADGKSDKVDNNDTNVETEDNLVNLKKGIDSKLLETSQFCSTNSELICNNDTLLEKDNSADVVSLNIKEENKERKIYEESPIKKNDSVDSCNALSIGNENNDSVIRSPDKLEDTDRSDQKPPNILCFKESHNMISNSETNSTSIKKKYKRIILDDCLSDDSLDSYKLSKNKKINHDCLGRFVGSNKDEEYKSLIDENDKRFIKDSRSDSDVSSAKMKIKDSNLLKKQTQNKKATCVSQNRGLGKMFIDFEAEVGEEWSDDNDGSIEEVLSSASSVKSISEFFDREAIEGEKKRHIDNESTSTDISDYADSVARLFQSPTNSQKDDTSESDIVPCKRQKLGKNSMTHKFKVSDTKPTKKQVYKIEKSFGFNEDLGSTKRSKVYKEYTKPGVFFVSSIKQCLEKPRQAKGVSSQKQSSRFPDSLEMFKEDSSSNIDCRHNDDSILRGFVITKVKHDQVKKNVRKTSMSDSGTVNHSSGWKIQTNAMKNTLSSDKSERKSKDSFEVTLILPSSSTSKTVKSALKRNGIGSTVSIKFVKPKVAIVKFKEEYTVKKALDLYGKLTIDGQPVYILEGSSCL